MAVGDSLTTNWDWGLIFVSFVIAVLGSGTTLYLLKSYYNAKFNVFSFLSHSAHGKSKSSSSSSIFSLFLQCFSTCGISLLSRRSQFLVRLHSKWIYLVGASISLGAIAIFSMHFIGIKAVSVIDINGDTLPLAFDPGLTVASLFSAIIFTFLGLTVMTHRQTPNLFSYVISAALTGSGVIVMHYVGMSAQIINASIHWDIGFIAGSIVIGVVVVLVALLIFFHFQRYWATSHIVLWVAATVMGFAVCCVHYVGVLAATYTEDDPDPNKTDGYVSSKTITGVVSVFSGCSSLFLIAFLIWRHRQELKQQKELSLSSSLLLSALIVDKYSPSRMMISQTLTLPFIQIDESMEMIDTLKNGEFSESNIDFIRLFRATTQWDQFSTRLSFFSKLRERGDMTENQLRLQEKFYHSIYTLANALQIPIESLGEMGSILYYKPTYNMITLIIPHYDSRVYGLPVHYKWGKKEECYEWIANYLGMNERRRNMEGRGVKAAGGGVGEWTEEKYLNRSNKSKKQNTRVHARKISSLNNANNHTAGGSDADMTSGEEHSDVENGIGNGAELSEVLGDANGDDNNVYPIAMSTELDHLQNQNHNENEEKEKKGKQKKKTPRGTVSPNPPSSSTPMPTPPLSLYQRFRNAFLPSQSPSSSAPLSLSPRESFPDPSPLSNIRRLRRNGSTLSMTSLPSEALASVWFTNVIEFANKMYFTYIPAVVNEEEDYLYKFLLYIGRQSMKLHLPENQWRLAMKQKEEEEMMELGRGNKIFSKGKGKKGTAAASSKTSTPFDKEVSSWLSLLHKQYISTLPHLYQLITISPLSWSSITLPPMVKSCIECEIKGSRKDIYTLLWKEETELNGKTEKEREMEKEQKETIGNGDANGDGNVAGNNGNENANGNGTNVLLTIGSEEKESSGDSIALSVHNSSSSSSFSPSASSLLPFLSSSSALLSTTTSASTPIPFVGIYYVSVTPNGLQVLLPCNGPLSLVPVVPLPTTFSLSTMKTIIFRLQIILTEFFSYESHVGMGNMKETQQIHSHHKLARKPSTSMGNYNSPSSPSNRIPLAPFIPLSSLPLKIRAKKLLDLTPREMNKLLNDVNMEIKMLKSKAKEEEIWREKMNLMGGEPQSPSGIASVSNSRQIPFPFPSEIISYNNEKNNPNDNSTDKNNDKAKSPDNNLNNTISYNSNTLPSSSATSSPLSFGKYTLWISFLDTLASSLSSESIQSFLLSCDSLSALLGTDRDLTFNQLISSSFDYVTYVERVDRESNQRAARRAEIMERRKRKKRGTDTGTWSDSDLDNPSDGESTDKSRNNSDSHQSDSGEESSRMNTTTNTDNKKKDKKSSSNSVSDKDNKSGDSRRKSRRSSSIGGLSTIPLNLSTPTMNVILFCVCRMSAGWPNEYNRRTLEFIPLPIFESIHLKQFYDENHVVAAAGGNNTSNAASAAAAAMASGHAAQGWMQRILKDKLNYNANADKENIKSAMNSVNNNNNQNVNGSGSGGNLFNNMGLFSARGNNSNNNLLTVLPGAVSSNAASPPPVTPNHQNNTTITSNIIGNGIVPFSQSPTSIHVPHSPTPPPIVIPINNFIISPPSPSPSHTAITKGSYNEEKSPSIIPFLPSLSVPTSANDSLTTTPYSHNANNTIIRQAAGLNEFKSPHPTAHMSAAMLDGLQHFSAIHNEFADMEKEMENERGKKSEEKEDGVSDKEKEKSILNEKITKKGKDTNTPPSPLIRLGDKENDVENQIRK